MSFIDDLKAKADSNGDGTVTQEDLESLRGGENDSMIDKLKGIADQNADGKLSFDDVKSFDLKGTAQDIKDRFSN